MKNSEFENCEKYEGKEVIVIYDINGYNEEFKAVVPGIDYNIGISIEVVDKEEQEHMREFFGNDEYYLFVPLVHPRQITIDSGFQKITQNQALTNGILNGF